MATWSRGTRTKQVHEWYIPNGCWNQLQQAINDAVRARAHSLGKSEHKEISDDALLFRAVDEGVILYYEIEINDPPF